MKPIFITCMGGTGSSLLTKTLVACGMEPGNEATYFEQRWLDWTCQHDIFTTLSHMYKDEVRFDLKWRTRGLKEEWARIHADVPSSIIDKITHILKSYVAEAEKNNWASFGLKDTRTNERMDKYHDITALVKTIWGEDTLFVTTVRDPVTYIHRLFKDERFLPTKGEHLVQYVGAWEAWRWMVDHEANAHFVPYPQAFEDGSIKDIVQGMGFTWTFSASCVYDGKKPTMITQELIDEFRDTFSLADEAINKYNQIVNAIGRQDCQINLR